MTHLRRTILILALLTALLGSMHPATAQIPGSGLNLWLRADVGVTVNSGNTVTSWQDGSGTGHHATNSVVGTQPILVAGALNGNPIIRFSGAQRLFAGAISLPTWTIFVVGKNNNPTEAFGEILGPGDGIGNNQLRYENGTQILTYGYSNNMPIIYSTVGNTRVYHAFSVRYNGGTFQVARDGVIKNTQSFATVGSWILGRIGTWFSSCSSCYLKGDLAEIIIYNRALSDAERSTVDSYLQSKYALP